MGCVASAPKERFMGDEDMKPFKEFCNLECKTCILGEIDSPILTTCEYVYRMVMLPKDTRIKELEAQLDRMKNSWNCGAVQITTSDETGNPCNIDNCPCENWQERVK
jgi:hypothetical protein